MKIAIINGPNINMLGIREKDLYGSMSYKELLKELTVFGKENGLLLSFYQSNHEGDLVDHIQSCRKKYDGIVINAAAYTHTSIALLDALLAVELPTVEVHITDIENRENFRKTSFIRLACIGNFQGEGIISYQKALLHLVDFLNSQSPQ